MALNCPRCRVLLAPLEVSAPAHDALVTADTCRRCAGLWLDGKEVAVVYPLLAPVLQGLQPGGPRGATGIERCPRCDDVPVEFPFAGVQLDYSPKCGGLWVDGLELLSLAREMAPREQPRAEQAHYRMSADDASLRGSYQCRKCKVVQPERFAVLTSDGPMCEPCAKEFEAADAGALNLADVAALRRAGVDPRAIGPSGPSLGAELLAALQWLFHRARAEGWDGRGSYRGQ
jgi:Zn-finger nucleic acid-binding protein